MNETVIKTEGLTKVYKDFWGRPKLKALDNLNMEVRKGEIFGLLGPNGSGKTTTLKLLLGLLFPTAGRAYILGNPAGEVSVYKKIGFLPEESYFYRFLNADETLEFYGNLFDIPQNKIKSRVNELIELVGLKDARSRRMGEYSKGMARRLGLAQSLINDPELVFLDEPTSGLDPIGAREVKDIILRLKQEGKTVLLCTHLLADVEDVCNRIAILHKGQLKQVGEVKELLSVKEITQIGLKQPGEEFLKELKSLIEREKIEHTDFSHPTETLEQLFLKTIRESE